MWMVLYQELTDAWFCHQTNLNPKKYEIIINIKANKC